MRFILMLIGLLFTAGIATGQEDKKVENKPRLEKMAQELELTDAQIKEIEERKANYDRVLNDASLSKEQKKEKIMQMKKTEKVILSEKQLEKAEMRKHEKVADRMILKHERVQKREKLSKLRAEFDNQISAEDRATIAKIKKTMPLKRGKDKSKGDSGAKRQNTAEMKQLKSLSLKYDDTVIAFLKENGVEKMKQKDKKEASKAKMKGKRKNRRKGGNGKSEMRTAKFLLMDF